MNTYINRGKQLDFNRPSNLKHFIMMWEELEGGGGERWEEERGAKLKFHAP